MAMVKKRNLDREVAMDELGDLEVEVLETLPVEPLGVSVSELAEDLLGDVSESSKRRMRHIIHRLLSALGELHLVMEPDSFIDRPVRKYGIPRHIMPEVREFCYNRRPLKASS